MNEYYDTMSEDDKKNKKKIPRKVYYIIGINYQMRKRQF